MDTLRRCENRLAVLSVVANLETFLPVDSLRSVQSDRSVQWRSVADLLATIGGASITTIAPSATSLPGVLVLSRDPFRLQRIDVAAYCRDSYNSTPFVGQPSVCSERDESWQYDKQRRGNCCTRCEWSHLAAMFSQRNVLRVVQARRCGDCSTNHATGAAEKEHGVCQRCYSCNTNHCLCKETLNVFSQKS